jgi:hypothetical protein
MGDPSRCLSGLLESYEYLFTSECNRAASVWSSLVHLHPDYSLGDIQATTTTAEQLGQHLNPEELGFQRGRTRSHLLS